MGASTEQAVCTSSSSCTPRTSRSISNIGRVLRSQLRRNKEGDSADTPKISSFFQVRKRHTTSAEDGKDTQEHLSKRHRRNDTIRNLKFSSPDLQYPGISPVPTGFDDDENDCAELDLVECPLASREEPTGLGVFNKLPPLFVGEFLDALSIQRLVDLSVMSHDWSEKVGIYMKSNACRTRFLKEAEVFSRDFSSRYFFFTSRDPFFMFGQLVKFATVCTSTSDRIAYAIRFCDRMKMVVDDKLGWGRFFNTISHKWAFTECGKLMSAVFECFPDVMKDVSSLFIDGYVHGANSALEMKVRNDLRGLFFDCIPLRPNVNREIGFWLTCLLHNTCPSIQKKARILSIMFSPTIKPSDAPERIDWRILVDDAIASWEVAESRVKPLSFAVYCLLQTKKLGLSGPGLEWSENDIFNLMEELTTYPEPWAFDNFVVLHMHWTCMIPISVCARIRHGYCVEAGNIINCMKAMLYRWDMDVVGVMRMPLMYCMQVLNKQQRRLFHNCIQAAHCRQCREYQLMGEASAIETASCVNARCVFSEHRRTWYMDGAKEDLTAEIRSQVVLGELLSEMGSLCN